MYIFPQFAFLNVLTITLSLPAFTLGYHSANMSSISIKNVTVDGVDLFYREAGAEANPTILLLHGFPSSSYQYRYMIPLLAERYHILAPDYPGFGFTAVPTERNYTYTFDSLANTITAWLDRLEIQEYSLYIFDYGAPVGLRLALQKPSAVRSIITQNGNAYTDGFGSDFWAPIKKYWASDSQEDRDALIPLALGFSPTEQQYKFGSQHPESLAPESWYLDYYLLTRPGNQDIQLNLFKDYKSNLALYPKAQDYFRTSQVPLLAVWGKNDVIFIPAGAEAFKRDLPNAEIHLIDAGHFASVSNTRTIVDFIFNFLEKQD